jgi:hypothetical protein
MRLCNENTGEIPAYPNGFHLTTECECRLSEIAMALAELRRRETDACPDDGKHDVHPATHCFRDASGYRPTCLWRGETLYKT